MHEPQGSPPPFPPRQIMTTSTLPELTQEQQAHQDEYRKEWDKFEERRQLIGPVFHMFPDWQGQTQSEPRFISDQISITEVIFLLEKWDHSTRLDELAFLLKLVLGDMKGAYEAQMNEDLLVFGSTSLISHSCMSWMNICAKSENDRMDLDWVGWLYWATRSPEVKLSDLFPFAWRLAELGEELAFGLMNEASELHEKNGCLENKVVDFLVMCTKHATYFNTMKVQMAEVMAATKDFWMEE